jgi:DNA-binding response OmpR family regulator
MQSAASTRKMSMPLRRAMIFDNSLRKYQDLIGALEKEGWEVQSHNDKQNAGNLVRAFQPSLVILNLFMSNSSSIGLVKEIAEISKESEIKTIVVTSHYSEENIKKCILAGASDFILEPFQTKLVLDRLKFQFQDKDVFNVDELKVTDSELKSCFNLVYECQRILAEFDDTHMALFECLKRLSEFTKATRVNILMADFESPKAIVVASSDDQNFKNASVDLERYPEVREVLLKNNIIFIKDINSNPLTQDIKKEVKSIEISSLAVLPIRHRKTTVGTLNVRLGSKSPAPSEIDLKSMFIIAMAIASKIAAKKLMRDRNKAPTDPK